MRRFPWSWGIAVLALVVAVGVGQATPGVAASPEQAGTFTVPLVSEVAADPSITYHNARYHMLYNKTGHYNQVVVRTATSLADMPGGEDHVIYDGTRNPAEISCGVGYGSWFLRWNAKWYLFAWGDDCTGVTTSRPFVAESSGSDILGPYTYKTTFSSPPPEIGGDNHGYAASPLVIDGRLYLTQTSNGRIFLAELSNPWTLETGWNLIAEPESSGWECANDRCLDEGGSVIVRDGRAFLLFSAGGYESPDYCVGMLEASTTSDLLLQSSWTKSSDCVFERNDAAGVYGPASMIHFESPDGTEDWVVYHVKTTTDLTGGDRYLQAKQIDWTADGMPDLGVPVAQGTVQPLPSGDPGRTGTR